MLIGCKSISSTEASSFLTSTSLDFGILGLFVWCSGERLNSPDRFSTILLKCVRAVTLNKTSMMVHPNFGVVHVKPLTAAPFSCSKLEYMDESNHCVSKGSRQ